MSSLKGGNLRESPLLGNPQEAPTGVSYCDNFDGPPILGIRHVIHATIKIGSQLYHLVNCLFYTSCMKWLKKDFFSFESLMT